MPFEIVNHLGNVLAVCSDRKIVVPSAANALLFDYYLADLYAVRDYQPFGMAIPERSWASEAGRFGFNGKEDDSEWQAQDYGERMYLPRQARFFSADPLIELGQSYAELSPYQFASNTPVQAVDLDGLEAAISTIPYVSSTPVLTVPNSVKIIPRVGPAISAVAEIYRDCCKTRVQCEPVPFFMNRSI